MDIFISGSLAYDRIMDFPGRFSDHILPEKIHILNVCFTVNGLTEKFGGTAGNIAYSLSLLGERPLILASAGNDFDRYENWLKRHNLPVDGIRRIAGELTAGAYITTDQADNQITGFNPGAMKYPSLYELGGVDAGQAIAAVSPGNIEDMVAYSRKYKELRIPYIFDPGQQIPVIPPEQLVEMLDGSAILISNDYELELIMSAGGLGKKQILRNTGSVVTTLGERGSIVQTPETATKIPVAEPDRVTDPTGAGDASRSGLIKGLAMGKPLVAAARMGATCASYAVEITGTQAHHFTEKAFRERHEKNFGADG